LGDFKNSSLLKPHGQMNRILVGSILRKKLMDQEGMSNRHRGPPIDASYQVADQLAM
jgi:hypothetical protein